MYGPPRDCKARAAWIVIHPRRDLPSVRNSAARRRTLLATAYAVESIMHERNRSCHIPC